jgi:DNA-binding MarR family transcriptional regulator
MAQGDRYPFLMSGVLEAWDWFDNGLQNLVKAGGFRPLNKSQSMMVLYISAGVRRPIEIARKMRLSRQAIRHIANQLMKMEIVVGSDDPTDGRSMILSFTAKSNDIRTFAQHAILDLEDVLRARLGANNYRNLRSVLELEWGPTVKVADDLPLTSRIGTDLRTRQPKAAAKAKRRKKRSN